MNETLQMDPSTGDRGTPPPPAGVPWYRVPIARDATNDKLGGVVAGVSRAYGFDVKTTRIAVALCTLVLPVLLFVYVVAWILLPADPAPARSLDDVVRDRRRRPLYVALAIIGVVLAFGSLGTWWIAGSFGWGVGLVVVGVLLWVASSSRRAGEWPAPTATPSTAPTPVPSVVPASTDLPPIVPATEQATTATATTGPTTGELPGTEAPVVTALPLTGTEPIATSGPAAPARPRRRRIPVASLTTVAVLIVSGVIAAGNGIGWWDASTLAVVVVGSIVVIAGLAISAIVNRAWWLAPVALVLAAGTTGLLIAQPDLDHGAGSRRVEITTPTTSVTERLGMGDLVIDLRETPIADGTTLSVVAEVGIGNLRIVVPEDAVLLVDARLGAGTLHVDGREVVSGIRTESITRRGTAGSGPEIDLDLTIGAGQIEVVPAAIAP